MRRRHHRSLRLENLENRRLLTVDPTGIDAAIISPGQHSIRDTVSNEVITIEKFQFRDKLETVFAEDFNGDGVTDLLQTDRNDDWYLSLNDGQTLYEIPVGDGLDGANFLDTADFNQDGLLDVVSHNATTGDLWVSLNRGTEFEHQVWGNFLSTADWTNIIVGDFDGDAQPDVLAEAGDYWWLASNNNGTNFYHYNWGRFPDFDWVDVIDGNFNGDQYRDVVARAPASNTWWMWEGTAEGFQSAEYFGHWKMNDTWMDVSAGDFNGDEIDDLIGRSEDGRLWVGSTTPQGLHTWSWATGWVDQARWEDVQVVDINGDGLADQVGRAHTNIWSFALNQGDGFHNHKLASTPFATPMFVQNFIEPEVVSLAESFGYEEPVVASEVGQNTIADRNRRFHDLLTTQIKVTTEWQDPGSTFNTLNLVGASYPFDGGPITLSGSGQLINKLELKANAGSLTGGDSASPFSTLTTNTEQRWSVESDAAVLIDGRIELDVIASGDVQLVATATNGFGTSDLQVQRRAPKSTTAISGSFEFAGGPVTLSSNRAVSIQALQLWAASGGLTAGADPAPFDNVVSSTPEKWIVESPDANVIIDGRVELSLQTEPNSLLTGWYYDGTETTSFTVHQRNAPSSKFELAGFFPPEGGNITVSPTREPIQAGGIEFVAKEGVLSQGSSAAPFAFFIPNSAAPGNVTLGSLGTPVTIDGLLELDVFVSAGTLAGDIVATWGKGVTPTAFPVSPRTSAGSVKATVVDANTADTDEDEEPANTGRVTSQVNLSGLSTDAALVGTFPPDGGKITVTTTSGPVKAGGIEFVAPEGHLTQGASPKPFDFFLANTADPGNVTFGSLGTPVTLDGSVELDVTAIADASILAFWGDGTTPRPFPISNEPFTSAVWQAELAKHGAHRIVNSETPPRETPSEDLIDNDPPETSIKEEPVETDTEPTQVDVSGLETDSDLVGTFPSDGGKITLTTTQGPIQAGGVELVAAPGILTKGSNPSPFAFFIPNGLAPGNVTFGTLGVPVTLDGSVELDVTVSPSAVSGDIAATWGKGVTPTAFPVFSGPPTES